MKIGIADAFRRYGANLKNVNWSVSAWADDTTLIVSLWDHHLLKNRGTGVLAFGDRFDRWTGPGNSEFRTNVSRAFKTQANVRLVLVRASAPERVQLGEDASKIPKTFGVREDLVGRVTELDGENYVIEFKRIVV